jgi:predicted anti-sigma-YlaC factor YlaD
MMDHLNNDFLIDYLHAQLPPEDDALAFAHLESCAACRSEYEAEAALSESLRTAALAEELEFPSLISAAVWEQVRQAQPGWGTRLAGLFRPAIAVPAAAVAVVALYFATPLSQSVAPPAKRISATYYLEAHAAQQARNPLGERSPTAAQLIESSALDVSGASDLADAVDAAPLAMMPAFDAGR